MIDVGSNTIRLLVAESSECGLVTVEERRAQVGLGVDVEDHGRVSKRKIHEAAVTVRRFATRAQELGCAGLVVAVTSPGRQAANADRLITQLERETTPHAVVVLSGEQEAQFAWAGAVSRCGGSEGSLLVCDVGGGSTELAFGTRPGSPVWLHSIDIGSLRLSRRLHADRRLTKKRLATGWAEVDALLDDSPMPAPLRAVAVGGSARAISRIAGTSLGAGQLSEAIRLLRMGSKGVRAKNVVIDPARTPTIAAGALILAALQRRIARSTRVRRGGPAGGARSLGPRKLLRRLGSRPERKLRVCPAFGSEPEGSTLGGSSRLEAIRASGRSCLA